MSALVIYGAGALGREVLAIAEDCLRSGQGLPVKGFLDRDPRALANHEVDLPILGGDDYEIDDDEDRFVIALGRPEQRAEAAAWVARRGGRLHTLVHPQAYVAERARLGTGCIVAAFCFVAVDARLGDDVFLNNYASVGHDAVIGAHGVLSPYAVVNGEVILGEGCFLGTHATVTQGASVGAHASVTAGSVVYGKVGDHALAHGNRARSRRRG